MVKKVSTSLSKGSKLTAKRKIDPYKRRYAKAVKKPVRAKNGADKTISKLKKELDTVFSLYIRLKDADEDGMVACYTCRVKYHYKKMHAGHYALRGYMATRWDEMNVKPQCGVDNLWRKGEPILFREHLIEEYGEEAVKALEARTKIITRLNRDYYLENIAKYKALLETV